MGQVTYRECEGKPYVAPRRQNVSVQVIVDAVSEIEAVPSNIILGPWRRQSTKPEFTARHVAIWLVFKLWDASIYQIADSFRRDPSTIRNAIQMHEKRMATDPLIRQRSETILDRFMGLQAQRSFG